MNRKEQELMERYIYQVIRRLPKAQQNEVGLELQELITDMLEESGSMEAVLTRLGAPKEFAKKYQDTTHYLIGPEYYDTYLWFLKIVLLCTAFAVLIASVITGITDGISWNGDYVDTAVILTIFIVVKAVGNLILSCAGAFGAVTLVFAAMERQKIKLDLKKEKEWSVHDLGDNFAGGKSVWTPRSLAPIPHKRAVISRGDSIVGIVFLVIFGALLIFAPRVFSAVFREDGTIITIPVFNLESWNIVLPLLLIGLLLGLTDEILRLITGCYCRLVMISCIICSVLQLIISVLVLKVFPFWNPDFGVQLKMQLGDQLEGIADFLKHWDGEFISNCFLGIIGIATLLEIGVTVYKTLRYGVEKRTSIGK